MIDVSGRRRRAVWAVAAALLACGVTAARGQVKVVSPYDQLAAESDKLIKRLSMLGMTELLDAMEREIPETDKSMRALGTRGRIRVGIAMALADKDQRNKLLDEGIALLRQAVKIGEKMASPSDAEMLLWLQYTRDLAVAMGRYRLEDPHMLRLRHLQGGEQDRRVVRKYTKEAVDLVDFLKDDINDFLQELRGDMTRFIVYGPKVEALQDEVWYNAALIRMNRAMVLEPEQRGLLCRDIFAEMKKFASDPQYGVQYDALYTIGVAQRLLKQHAQADRTLGKAAVPENPSKDLRQRAWFERARNRIEEGDPAKAEQAIKDFERGSLAIWGEQRRPLVDLRVIFLRNYMYELQAAGEKDAKKAAALREKAQTVLLSFVEKYADRPALVKAFLDIVATKFAGVEDLEKASAVVLLARAYSKIDSKDAAEVAEAEALLKKVLEHKDLANPRIAASIEPGVLWELAFIKNKARENAAAAEYFIRLARKYPSHRLGPKAARFAAVSLREVFNEYEAKGTEVTTGLRLGYVRAIETLLSVWSEPEEVLLWNFDLGTQCVALATANQSTVVKFFWQARAISALEKITPKYVEYMEAQNTALAMRSQIVLKRADLARALAADNARAGEDLAGLARQLIEAETAGPGGAPTTAPAGGGAGADVAGRVEKIRAELAAALKRYSDPQALVERLRKYAAAAAAESEKEARLAAGESDAEKKKQHTLLADQLRRFGARAEFQAVEIAYEQIAAGEKDPEKRGRMEAEALEALRALPEKWPGTPVLEEAAEFEIRKLVERGETARAIEMIQGFKKDHPERAQQLIALVVAKIEERVNELGSALREATTSTEAEKIKAELRKYQLAFAGFAQDLYRPIEGKSIALDELDRAVRAVEAMEKKQDLAGVLAEAKKFTALAEKFAVPLEALKGAATLADLIAEAQRPGAQAGQVLPNLAGAALNALNDLRDVVLERYRTAQLFADSLVHKGRAEALAGEALEAKAAFQTALKLYEQCAAVDAARRKVEADLLKAKYAPRIARAGQVRSMEEVRRGMDELKKELVRLGRKPENFPDTATLEYAYEYLSKAPNPQEEQRRLPRAKTLLVRAWEHLRDSLINRLPVDHRNVIGQARAHQGLKQYAEAMKFYRQYTAGVPESSQFFWRSQLERCQCHLEGYRNSTKAMKNLVIHIRMLAIKDKTMGGLAREFLEIRREAEKAAGKATAGAVGASGR